MASCSLVLIHPSVSSVTDLLRNAFAAPFPQQGTGELSLSGAQGASVSPSPSLTVRQLF